MKKEANDAYKKLFAKKTYKPEDISHYSKLIDATNDVFKHALSKGITDNEIPTAMRLSLEKDIFVFSALKTHAQLLEASRMLLTDDGKVKSLKKFSQDVKSIKENYNQNYLESEYQFAVSSSQQAANWIDVEKNEERYNLQYRTAHDDRVRDSHAELEGITLPVKDSFWDDYYPPNGWRCRCKAIEVLKGKYDESDSANSLMKGTKATTHLGKDGKNRLEIFRFNPGKEKVIFPKNHPYKPRGCDGGLLSLKNASPIYLSSNEDKCKVKSIAEQLLIDSKFKTEKIGEGTLSIHENLDTAGNDYKSVLSIGKHFARQGNKVILPPRFNATLKNEEYSKIYFGLKDTPFWGKCPDVIVNNHFYEHEGFITKNPKNALRNMMNRGLKQSDKLIINKSSVNERYLKNNIISRIKKGQNIEEVWEFDGTKIRLVYKKQKFDK